MKLLITIPNYFNAESSGHGSLNGNAWSRIQALTMSLFNLRALFSQSQCMIDIFNKKTVNVNNSFKYDIDIVICTANGKHLLDKLKVPQIWYKHQDSNLEDPKFLGFECHKVLKDNIGKYDYYCFMEDDLIINDPYFFEKIKWFNKNNGEKSILQPNRYEVSSRCKVLKAYIDGDIRPGVTEKFQNVNEFSEISAEFLSQNVIFKRPYNPHSGCFFLNQKQMEHWANQPYFLDKDTSFISPLESAASLGITKTFRIYKSAPSNANFLEIQHFGDSFLRLII